MAVLFDFGKSRMCPTEARTVNLPSRYFSIVFAFEGDSAKATNEAQPGLITRRELVLLRHLCNRLESFGVTKKRLRDEMELLSGCRFRKDLTTADAFRVISSFAHTLNGLLATRAEQ